MYQTHNSSFPIIPKSLCISQNLQFEKGITPNPIYLTHLVIDHVLNIFLVEVLIQSISEAKSQFSIQEIQETVDERSRNSAQSKVDNLSSSLLLDIQYNS